MGNDLITQYGSVVTELCLPYVKTFDELFKAFTLKDRISISITKVSLFLYKTPISPEENFQFATISSVVELADNIIHEKEGEKLFAIINSSKSIDGQIFFAYQRSDKENNVEVISMYGNRPKSEGVIQINGLNNKIVCISVSNRLVKTKKKNNKKYTKLE